MKKHRSSQAVLYKDLTNSGRRLPPGEAAETEEASQEVGGPKGLEPTRYGDWEKSGRCIDF